MTESGKEIPDSTPMEPPVGYKPTPDLHARMQEMIRSERLAWEAERAGYETFEESDDFDIPDDPIDPTTPYENEFDPSLAETDAALKEARRRRVKGKEAKPSLDDPATPEDNSTSDDTSDGPKPSKKAAAKPSGST